MALARSLSHQQLFRTLQKHPALAAARNPVGRPTHAAGHLGPKIDAMHQ
jgi:hypothetical protein